MMSSTAPSGASSRSPSPSAEGAAPATVGELIKSTTFQALRRRLAKQQDRILRDADYRAPHPRDRFAPIRPELRTSWRLPGCALDGGLNANYIAVEGRRLAVVAQYPHRAELCAFLSSVMAEGTRTIFVLAPEAEIDNPSYRMPPYFRASETALRDEWPRYSLISNSLLRAGEHSTSIGLYEDTLHLVEIQSLPANNGIAQSCPAAEAHNIDEVRLRLWQCDEPFRAKLAPQQIAELGQPPIRTRELRVIHLRGVNVGGAPSVELTEWFGRQVLEARARDDALPVLHCQSGTGRSGLVVAAAALMDGNSDLPLETVVNQIRASRHWTMVRSDEQLATLALIALRQGKGLLATPVV